MTDSVQFSVFHDYRFVFGLLCTYLRLINLKRHLFLPVFSISDHADSGIPPHNGTNGFEHWPALQSVPVAVPSAGAATACQPAV